MFFRSAPIRELLATVALSLATEACAADEEVTVEANAAQAQRGLTAALKTLIATADESAAATRESFTHSFTNALRNELRSAPEPNERFSHFFGLPYEMGKELDDSFLFFPESPESFIRVLEASTAARGGSADTAFREALLSFDDVATVLGEQSGNMAYGQAMTYELLIGAAYQRAGRTSLDELRLVADAAGHGAGSQIARAAELLNEGQSGSALTPLLQLIEDGGKVTQRGVLEMVDAYPSSARATTILDELSRGFSDSVVRAERLGRKRYIAAMLSQTRLFTQHRARTAAATKAVELVRAAHPELTDGPSLRRVLGREWDVLFAEARLAAP